MRVLGGAALFVVRRGALTSAGAQPVFFVAGPGGRARARAAVRGPRPSLTWSNALSKTIFCTRAASSARVVVIHDPLCPLVSPADIRAALRALGSWHRDRFGPPVLDTVKAARDGVICETLDRDALRIVVSPVVVSGAQLAEAPDLAPCSAGRLASWSG